MSRKRPLRFTHYRDRDQPNVTYKPAICGARGGAMGYYEDEVDCPECLAVIAQQGITLRRWKGAQ